jgi:hypothetical protein
VNFYGFVWGSKRGAGKRFSLFQTLPDCPWGPIRSCTVQGVTGSLPRSKWPCRGLNHPPRLALRLTERSSFCTKHLHQLRHVTEWPLPYTKHWTERPNSDSVVYCCHLVVASQVTEIQTVKQSVLLKQTL